MHEKISIEIHVWPLTGPFSCLIDFSIFHMLMHQVKTELESLGMLGSSSNPCADIRQRRGFVAIVSDLEKTRHSSQTHRDTLFFLPHECHSRLLVYSHRYVCVHLCVCVFTRA